MQIKGIGVDIVEVNRVKQMVETHPLGVKKRIFTDSELNYCYAKNNPFPHLAARFAAKEAAAKAFGTGIRGIGWKEIEIIKENDGQVGINLSGRAKQLALELGITNFLLSLSHSREYAVAQAIAVGGGNRE